MIKRLKRREQLGLSLPTIASKPIWIHACSVGEVASIAPLAKRLHQQGLTIHITVITDTGYAHAQRLLGSFASVSFLVFDVFRLPDRFLAHIQARLLLIAETEFWPGLLAACRRAHMPVISINSRISDRSFPRYHATRWLWKRFLRDVRLFLAQSQRDAERLQALGLQPQRIRNLGNLKYAINPPKLDSQALREKLDASGRRPIFLFASTHEGEEAYLIKGLQDYLHLAPNALLVFVPRHPERFQEVHDLLHEHGYRVGRWSQQNASPQTDAVLIDAMGILNSLYSIADIAFIGGSISKTGGHNPLEAAVCGRGVITGPYVHNFHDIMSSMSKAGAAIVAEQPKDVTSSIKRCLQHPDELQQLHVNAMRFMQQQQQVLDHYLEALEPYL